MNYKADIVVEVPIEEYLEQKIKEVFKDCKMDYSDELIKNLIELTAKTVEKSTKHYDYGRGLGLTYTTNNDFPINVRTGYNSVSSTDGLIEEK